MQAELESEIWQQYRHSRELSYRDQLFLMYKEWAQYEALRIFRQLPMLTVELAEYEQWAYQGMLEAIERFDPELNIGFKSFAVHRVRGAIFSALPQVSEVSAYYAGRGRFQTESNNHTAQQNSDSHNEPISALVAMVSEMALEYVLKEPESDLTQLTGEFYSSPEINTITLRVREHVENLDDPLNILLKLYYFDAVSFDKVAQILDLSTSRISQLHKKAISILKRRLGW